MHEITSVYGVTTWARDLAKTRAFYTGVLGLPEIDRPGEHDGVSVASFACGALNGPHVAALSVFATEDVDTLKPDGAPLGAVVLAVPHGGLPIWRRHLIEHGVRIAGRAWGFDEEHLCFTDTDGFDLALVEDAADWPSVSPQSASPEQVRILRLRSVELPAYGDDGLQRLLQLVGLTVVARDGPVTRLQFGAATPIEFIDVFLGPRPASLTNDPSRIRRVALKAKDSFGLARLAKDIAAEGFRVIRSGLAEEPLRIDLPISHGLLISLWPSDPRTTSPHLPEGLG